MSQPAPAPPAAGQLQADSIIVLENVTWADYQRILEIRGERPVPRLTYLEGVLELMTPSRSHEAIKSMVGRLVEAWCTEKGIPITPYGSWTLEDKEADRGAQPDECYVLGDATEPERPDLAIEVIWSRTGIDKLDVYRKLRVKEVWIWESGEIRVFELRDTTYVPIERSRVLSGIDLATLLRFVGVRPMTRAVAEYRGALRTSAS